MKEQRTIVVTGCSSGIGAHCARRLAACGWRVFATARKDADLAALADDGLEALHLDYREPASIAALVETVLARTGGRLDALFNNGAHGQAGAVEDLPPEALREQFEVNVIGWHDLTRRLVPTMRAQRHGRIVQCSSILGLVPYPWRGAYNASKHALEALSLTLRMELAGSGVTVSLIEPGPIRSRFTENGLTWFHRYVDARSSVHAGEYERQIARLSGGGTSSRFKLGPEAVYRVLDHALTARRPRPHYDVTVPAKVAVALKRVMPPAAFYAFLARQG